MLEVKDRATEPEGHKGRDRDDDQHREQDHRVSNAMLGSRSDDHRGRVVLERRHQATHNARQCRPVRLEHDRSHRTKQQDAATLPRDDIRKQRGKVGGDQPEGRTREWMPGRDQPVQEKQGKHKRGRVDSGPHLDGDVLGQQGHRRGERRERGWAHELVEPAGRRDDVKARDVLSGGVIHVRGIGQVGMGAFPHAFGVEAARREEGEDHHAYPERGGERPVKRRPREDVGGGARQTSDQSVGGLK